MKNLLITISVLTLTMNINAQDGYDEAIATFLAAQLHQDSIDVSDFVVVYKYTCKTFDADNKPVTDSIRLALQVSNNGSRFHPYYKYLEDTQGVDYFTPENYQLVKSEAFCHIPEVWMDYKERKQTVRDIIAPNNYETCEDIPWLSTTPAWTEWERDTVTIKGYLCKTARCEFHGQGWTARYTEEIPIFAGPWKLGGLPGLILDAESRDGIHRFSLESLSNVKTTIYYEHNAITQKISDEKLIKQRNKIFGNKQYPKNPLYYITDRQSLNSTANVINLGYFGDDNEIGDIINGAYISDKAHVYQPLEK